MCCYKERTCFADSLQTRQDVIHCGARSVLGARKRRLNLGLIAEPRELVENPSPDNLVCRASRRMRYVLLQNSTERFYGTCCGKLVERRTGGLRPGRLPGQRGEREDCCQHRRG